MGSKPQINFEKIDRVNKRMPPGWIPNQHGAWAMLISPFLVGVLASEPRWVHLPLALFWLLGYFAFFATSLWLKANRRPRWFPPVRAYSIAAACVGVCVLVLDSSLILWAPVFVGPLVVGLWAASQRRERDLLIGITTLVGAAAMTLMTYDIGHGSVTVQAWKLALIQLLYFGGTVFYVKSAIRERDNSGFLRISIAFHVAATVAAWVLSPWLGLVFSVLLIRAAVLPPRHPSPRTLGLIEVAATVMVALVSIAVV